MGALLPLVACSLMMGVVAVGFLVWNAVGARKTGGERSEVVGLREEIAELRRQPPAASTDAASRRGD